MDIKENQQATPTSPLPFYNVLNSIFLFLIPQKCCDTFLIHLDVLHAECLKILISKGLGYAIIVASIIVKLPQIMKILKAGSAEGISFLGQFMELTALTATMTYSIYKGFPFSSFGEAVFLSIQTSGIAFLTLYYGNQKTASFLFLGLYGLVVAYLSSPAAPFAVLQTLQMINTPVVATGKLLQVVANFRQGHTGQLSAITLILVFVGSVTRIFTSIQETGDSLVILSFVVSSACNGILVLQLFLYWNVIPPTATKSTKKTN